MGKTRSVEQICWTPDFARDVDEAFERRLHEVVEQHRTGGAVTDAELAVLRHDERRTRTIRVQQSINRIQNELEHCIKEMLDTQLSPEIVELEADLVSELVKLAFVRFHDLTGFKCTLQKMLKNVGNLMEHEEFEAEWLSGGIRASIDCEMITDSRNRKELEDLL